MAAPAVLVALKAVTKAKTIWDNKDVIIKIIIGGIATVFLLTSTIAFMLLGGMYYNLNVPADAISDTFDYLNNIIEEDSEISSSTMARLLTIGSLKTYSFSKDKYDVKKVCDVYKNGSESLNNYLDETQTKQYEDLFNIYNVIFGEFTRVNEWTETREDIIDVEVINPTTKKKEIVKLREVTHIEHRSLDYNFYFPIDGEFKYSDTWGGTRGANKERRHQGTDIMADKDTPIVAVLGGTVNNEGWNGLGGWSLMISTNDNLRFYYAHMSRRSTLRDGDFVQPGEIIGYIGNSGSGGGPVSEGTFAAGPHHLHLGIQIKTNGKTYQWINPYEFLKFFENNRM